MCKVIRDCLGFVLCDWPGKKLLHFLEQSNIELKPNAIWCLAFTRLSGSSNVFAVTSFGILFVVGSDWLLRSLWFCFSMVGLKALYKYLSFGRM